jgi:hypothetical protein
MPKGTPEGAKRPSAGGGASGSRGYSGSGSAARTPSKAIAVRGPAAKRAAAKQAKKTAKIIKNINKPDKSRAGKRAAKSGAAATAMRTERMMNPWSL